MNVVLQVNSFVQLTRTNFPEKKLYNYVWKLLDPKGKHSSDESRCKLKVPLSIICYSRKVVGESASTLLAISGYSTKTDPIVIRRESTSKRMSKRRKTSCQKSDLTSISYDVSLLRQCLSIALLDNQSSRNYLETLERDGHINPKIQEMLLQNYANRQSVLAYKLSSSHTSTSNETLTQKQHLWSNFNVFYARSALNDAAFNLFLDRLQDYYDLCHEVTTRYPKNTKQVTSVSNYLRRKYLCLVHRWFLHPSQTKNSDHAFKAPSLRQDTTFSQFEEIVLNKLHNFFHDICVFLQLLNSGEKVGLASCLKQSRCRKTIDIQRCFDHDTWFEHCTSNNLEERSRNVKSKILDPEETYQGPKMLLPPAWNKLVSYTMCTQVYFVFRTYEINIFHVILKIRDIIGHSYLHFSS